MRKKNERAWAWWGMRWALKGGYDKGLELGVCCWEICASVEKHLKVTGVIRRGWGTHCTNKTHGGKGVRGGWGEKHVCPELGVLQKGLRRQGRRGGVDLNTGFTLKKNRRGKKFGSKCKISFYPIFKKKQWSGALPRG